MLWWQDFRYAARLQWVSGDFFPVLGVIPPVGRLRISRRRHQLAFWQREFGGEASAIGGKSLLNGHPIHEVGVTSPEFSSLLPGVQDEPLGLQRHIAHYGAER